MIRLLLPLVMVLPLQGITEEIKPDCIKMIPELTFMQDYYLAVIFKNTRLKRFSSYKDYRQDYQKEVLDPLIDKGYIKKVNEVLILTTKGVVYVQMDLLNLEQKSM